ncbi:hypothetical protein QFC21_000111 [Naganishia friedmannii]|uniref:Uncharacterized protein n=1 Tax=Naganishia friedmannii TaxID=89922 RepID=A0ACC2WD58_9TREE|nr:hypothetical protein QFC21_000111 [Naganishia friedmannii]
MSEGRPNPPHHGQYLAPQTQPYATSSGSSASTPATTPTTPTFPLNRDLAPSPVPSTHSSVNTIASSQTQYRVRLNPTTGNRVSSRSRQSSKPSTIGMPGLGFPGTVRGVGPMSHGTPSWNEQGGDRSTTYPSHGSRVDHATLPPLAPSELPTRTVNLANPLARSGRAPPASAAPVPMRGSHFITPTSMQPMHVIYSGGQPPYGMSDAQKLLAAASPPPQSGASSSNVSTRTVIQSDIGPTRRLSSSEQAHNVTTPRKPSLTNGSLVSASSSSSSAKLTSPPPPMPPPRDIPLPPLPATASNSLIPENGTRTATSSSRYDGERLRGGERQMSSSNRNEQASGPIPSGSARPVSRNRDVSAPAAMTSVAKEAERRDWYAAQNGNQHGVVLNPKKMSSPPLGGLFSRKAGKSSSSLNSTGGSAPKVRGSDAPSEFGVLPRGPTKQVESMPLAPPATSRNPLSNENQQQAGPHSMPVSNGKRSVPPLGLGRPSTSYLASRRSEEVNRHFSGGESSSDFAKSVQARKSSGGLRALFSRNKPKDRPDDRKTPSPVAQMPMRLPGTQPLATRRRASEDMLRSRKVEAGPSRHEPNSISSKPPLRPLPNSVSDNGATRPSPGTQVVTSRMSEGRSNTPQPPPSPPTPTASTSQIPVSAEAKQPPLQHLPPTVSLHLGDLPQLDLSLGSTFDSLMKSFEFGTRMSPVATQKSPLSPKRPHMHSRRRSRSFSEYSHSSSGQSLTTRETSARLNKRESRVNSSASLAADLAAYGALEPPAPRTGVPSSMSSLSVSNHARTFSGTSSSLSEHSPPRTPGTNEGDPATIYNSTSFASADTLHGDASTDSTRVPNAPLDGPSLSTSQDKTPRAVRPSLLQHAESQRSMTPIMEQDEAKFPEQIVKPAESLSALGLAPPLKIAKTVDIPLPVKEEKKTRRIRLPRRSRMVESQYTLIELTEEIRRILVVFRRASATKSADKAGLIRNELLDCLVEGEKKGFDASDKAGSAALRAASIEWLELLLVELKIDQPANERGACLEALSSIMERLRESHVKRTTCSPVLSARALDNSPREQAVFRSLMVRIMTYVLEKLSGKGVFHNTLMFAGRMLAFAFFRIEGVAVQLLSALPTKQATLSRFAIALESFSAGSSTYSEIRYPAHLQDLQFKNTRSYMTTLNHTAPVYEMAEEAQAFHFKPGNWLRRWQSDDSELFPAFYKAYHRQLARYLAPALKASDTDNVPLPIPVLMHAPGYVHLAAIFATKCQSYINGAVNAVTTTSASSSFTADESASMRGNVKPPVLETANRRLSELILYLATSKLFVPSSASAVTECDGVQLWANIIDIWIKYLISRTSLYSPKAVFCLFDLLDVIMMPPSPQLMSPDISTNNKITLIDIRYLISVVKTILTQTEHHLTLAKCIAFVWTHFDTLCYQAEDREALCLHLLLDPALFERLMLFWSQSVRSYVLRLVVFRLGHISTSASDFANHNMELSVVQLLNASLEKIRARHDELEPHLIVDERGDTEVYTGPFESAGRGIVRSRSTITMVDAIERLPSFEQESTNAEQLLGLVPASPSAETFGGEDEPEVITSKAKAKSPSWFKKSFGKSKKTKRAGPEDSDNESPTSSGRPSLEGPSAPLPISILKPTIAAATSTTAGSDTALFTNFSDGLSTDCQGPIRSGPTASESSLTPSPGAQQVSQNRASAPTSPVQRTFEFELPTASPRSDTFDRPTMPGSPSLLGNNMASNPPKLPASPHMSRSFSKRSSLLHPMAVSAIDGSFNPAIRKPLVSVLIQQPPYDKRFHPYCIRMLAELEDVRREYDEWWAEDGPGQQDNAPPRLNVAWPFSEDED